MPRTVVVTEFQRHRGEFLQAVRNGETIAIARRGKIVAHFCPYVPPVEASQVVRRTSKPKGR